MNMKIEPRYLDGSYFAKNPDWDRSDSEWKATLVRDILVANNLKPMSICEVGCGAGDILRHLSEFMPKTAFYGFDVAPQLVSFWESASSGFSINSRVTYTLGDFYLVNKIKYDALLMLDVFEHVRDPFTFLEDTLLYADKFVFHIPIDLSASSVLRKKPLLYVRRSVGHLNFYTKDLALETLRDCGYKIIDWKYTNASVLKTNPSLQSRLLGIPRRLINLINRDFGVRLLGGETLIVLAEKAEK
jgi:hypothetical protein